MQNVSVKELNHKELSEALSLVWQVFLQYEAPDYTKEGIEEFWCHCYPKPRNSHCVVFCRRSISGKRNR